MVCFEKEYRNVVFSVLLDIRKVQILWGWITKRGVLNGKEALFA